MLPHACPVCHRRFSKAVGLARHLRVHSKRNARKSTVYECSECCYVSNWQSNLTRHLKIRCRGHALLRCRRCNRAFKKKSDLYRHACCNKDQQQNEATMDAKRIKLDAIEMDPEDDLSLTDDEKANIVCKKCNMRFRFQANLIRHVATHDDGKPFPCDQCDQGFNWKSNLLRHVKVHHAGAKPYSCGQCDRAFAMKHMLKRHSKSHSEGPRVSGSRKLKPAASAVREGNAIDESASKPDEVSPLKGNMLIASDQPNRSRSNGDAKQASTAFVQIDLVGSESSDELEKNCGSATFPQTDLGKRRKSLSDDQILMKYSAAPGPADPVNGQHNDEDPMTIQDLAYLRQTVSASRSKSSVDEELKNQRAQPDPTFRSNNQGLIKLPGYTRHDGELIISGSMDGHQDPNQDSIVCDSLTDGKGGKDRKRKAFTQSEDLTLDIMKDEVDEFRPSPVRKRRRRRARGRGVMVRGHHNLFASTIPAEVGKSNLAYASTFERMEDGDRNVGSNPMYSSALKKPEDSDRHEKVGRPDDGRSNPMCAFKEPEDSDRNVGHGRSGVGRSNLASPSAFKEPEDSDRNVGHGRSGVGRSNLASPSAFKELEDSDLDSEPEPFTPRRCAKTLTRLSLKRSGDEARPAAKQFQCSFCDRVFGRRSSHLQHERSHLRKPVSCFVCGKRFARQALLNRHALTHGARRCGYCLQWFGRRAELLEHMRTHHGFGDEPHQEETESGSDVANPGASHAYNTRFAQKTEVSGSVGIGSVAQNKIRDPVNIGEEKSMCENNSSEGRRDDGSKSSDRVENLDCSAAIRNDGEDEGTNDVCRDGIAQSSVGVSPSAKQFMIIRLCRKSQDAEKNDEAEEKVGNLAEEGCESAPLTEDVKEGSCVVAGMEKKNSVIENFVQVAKSVPPKENSAIEDLAVSDSGNSDETNGEFTKTCGADKSWEEQDKTCKNSVIETFGQVAKSVPPKENSVIVDLAVSDSENSDETDDAFTKTCGTNQSWEEKDETCKNSVIETFVQIAKSVPTKENSVIVDLAVSDSENSDETDDAFTKTCGTHQSWEEKDETCKNSVIETFVQIAKSVPTKENSVIVDLAVSDSENSVGTNDEFTKTCGAHQSWEEQDEICKNSSDKTPLDVIVHVVNSVLIEASNETTEIMPLNSTNSEETLEKQTEIRENVAGETDGFSMNHETSENNRIEEMRVEEEFSTISRSISNEKKDEQMINTENGSRKNSDEEECFENTVGEMENYFLIKTRDAEEITEKNANQVASLERNDPEKMDEIDTPNTSTEFVGEENNFKDEEHEKNQPSTDSEIQQECSDFLNENDSNEKLKDANERETSESADILKLSDTGSSVELDQITPSLVQTVEEAKQNGTIYEDLELVKFDEIKTEELNGGPTRISAQVANKPSDPLKSSLDYEVKRIKWNGSLSETEIPVLKSTSIPNQECGNVNPADDGESEDEKENEDISEKKILEDDSGERCDQTENEIEFISNLISEELSDGKELIEASFATNVIQCEEVSTTDIANLEEDLNDEAADAYLEKDMNDEAVDANLEKDINDEATDTNEEVSMVVNEDETVALDSEEKDFQGELRNSANQSACPPDVVVEESSKPESGSLLRSDSPLATSKGDVEAPRKVKKSKTKGAKRGPKPGSSRKRRRQVSEIENLLNPFNSFSIRDVGFGTDNKRTGPDFVPDGDAANGSDRNPLKHGNAPNDAFSSAGFKQESMPFDQRFPIPSARQNMMVDHFECDLNLSWNHGPFQVRPALTPFHCNPAEFGKMPSHYTTVNRTQAPLNFGSFPQSPPFQSDSGRPRSLEYSRPFKNDAALGTAWKLPKTEERLGFREIRIPSDVGAHRGDRQRGVPAPTQQQVECTRCDRSFKRKEDMIRHRFTEHEKNCF